ncbi:MAG TPA: helix-turn-helix domain-containing protein [Tepidisphaeraceae bacterium]|jgi:ribosome-binding protein aMBF1 (putative translation factor)|nr:helix-turn-helix domain-containing protein [Tepidisphaeraceae bacterium]
MKTLVEKGRKFVLVPVEAWEKIACGAVALPELPEPDAEGNMDALEFARATIARGIIRDRVAAGLSQAELARRAGIQPAVLNRIEKAKVVPDNSTIKKIDAALAGGKPEPRRRPTGRRTRGSQKQAKKTSL